MEAEEDEPQVHHAERLWWDRGYDSPIGGGGPVCRRCGCLVNRGESRAGQPFWQVHDTWHEALDGR